MKILITGIYGFLGSHLAEKLAQTHAIVGLYHTPKQVLLNGNIVCFSSLDSVHETPDAIVMCHAAVSSGNTSLSQEELWNSNVEFTKRIIEKFPKVKTIYVSSVAVFGQTVEIINESTPTNPQTDYGVSKLAGEEITKQNPNGINIRFSSLYGNNMKANTLIPNYCIQALHSKIIEVWGDGSRFQNYIHVDDAVGLIETVLHTEENINFPVLGVASKEYSNDQVAKIISDLTNATVHYSGEDLAISMHYQNQLTQKVVNWSSKIQLKEGLKKYLEWKEKVS